MKHLIAIAVSLIAVGVQAQTSSAIEQGRALYFGAQAFAAAPTVNGMALPAGNAACVNCHGALGAGSREGVQAAPDITQRMLSKPSSAWLHAALQGKANEGRVLNALMPRYALTDAEQAALMAYAPLLGQAQDAVRGVSDNEILLGLLSEEAHIISANSNILKGVEHQFASINKRGGVHGRMLRVKLVHNLQEAQSVFALMASLYTQGLSNEQLAQQRMPHLAALTQSMQQGGVRDWTVPLLASVQSQTRLLMHSLAELATQQGCEAWLIDTAKDAANTASNQEIAALKLKRFHTAEEAMKALTPHSKLCIGWLATPALSELLLQQLQAANAQVVANLTLAVLGSQTMPSTAQHYQVLPMPQAIAQHAQGMWMSLGQAAAQAVAEALSRSGRLLQPEGVLANMRKLTGYAPLPDAPLAWSNTQAHGFEPSLVQLSAPKAIATTTPTTRILGDAK
jgi:mono/diheme cytochrome c family protein